MKELAKLIWSDPVLFIGTGVIMLTLLLAILFFVVYCVREVKQNRAERAKWRSFL